MVQVDIDKAAGFITKVFNFYNGRINTFNPARLQIEWIHNSTNAAGQTKNPNMVLIYPLTVAKYSDSEYKFFYILLETIIHELYHIDQIIDYPLMVFDNYYLARVECAVEEQTNIYLANNKQEIFENFGIDVSMVNNTILSNINKYAGALYHRRRSIDHLFVILKEVDALSITKNNLQELLYGYDINTVSITINGKLCATSIDNINLINNFFYNMYFKYTLLQDVNMSIFRESEILNINISFIPSKKMARLFKGNIAM